MGAVRTAMRRNTMEWEDEQVGCPKWYPLFLSGLGLGSLLLYQLFA